MTVAVQSTPITGIPIACRYQTGGADNLGRTSVTTTGYASFNASTNYVLTAPTVHSAGGKLYRFKEWRFRTAPYGAPVFYSTFADTLFLADARDDVAVAVYDEARAVAIGSRNPTSGIAINVSPSDVQSSGNGTTSFTRHYVPGTNVTFTAPAANGSHPFNRWYINGVAQAQGVNPIAIAIGASNVTVEAEYCTHTHGSAMPFGAGCLSSTGNTPNHFTNSHADARSTVRFEVTAAPANSSAALFVGFSNTLWGNIPLPLNLSLIGADPTCYLNVELVASLGFTTDGAGSGFKDLYLRSTTPLGLKIYTQTVYLDFGVPAPLKIIVSNGLEVTTGGNVCN